MRGLALIAALGGMVACQERAAPPADALASRNTNSAGVIADVMEFRRKGSVLTAVVRLRNVGTNAIALVEPRVGAAFLLDEPQGKKYQVLSDENGTPIADGGRSIGLTVDSPLTIWMKFPAPPVETRTVSLTIPEMALFEDLPIQTP
jgi:hypothetical protein